MVVAVTDIAGKSPTMLRVDIEETFSLSDKLIVESDSLLTKEQKQI
jgi:hypothetical protein